jgi:hypothetical protein
VIADRLVSFSACYAGASLFVFTQVDKIPAHLADDGAGNPVFLLRQGSQYLLELTVMHAQGAAVANFTNMLALLSCTCRRVY